MTADLLSSSGFSSAQFYVPSNKFISTVSLALVGEYNFPPAAGRIQRQSFLKRFFYVATPDLVHILLIHKILTNICGSIPKAREEAEARQARGLCVRHDTQTFAGWFRGNRSHLVRFAVRVSMKDVVLPRMLYIVMFATN